MTSSHTPKPLPRHLAPHLALPRPIAWAAGALVLAAGLLAHPGVRADAQLDEMRQAAAVIAQMENALKPGTAQAYCQGVHSGPAYEAYLLRACQAGVANRLRQPQECTAPAVQAEASQDVVKCNARPFDLTAEQAKVSQARANFIRAAAARGQDGARLIQDQQGPAR